MPNLRGLKGTLSIIKWFAVGIFIVLTCYFHGSGLPSSRPHTNRIKDKSSLKSQQLN